MWELCDILGARYIFKANIIYRDGLARYLLGNGIVIFIQINYRYVCIRKASEFVEKNCATIL